MCQASKPRERDQEAESSGPMVALEFGPETTNPCGFVLERYQEGKEERY